MTRPPDERNDLTQRINRLHYTGERSVWMKAAKLSALRRIWTADDSAEEIVDRYTAAVNPTPELCREVLRVFLEEWVDLHMPEDGSGANPEDVDDFRQTNQSEAASVVDTLALVAEMREGNVSARHPWEPSDGPEDEQPISYPQLRKWFLEDLFDQSDVKYFVIYPGKGELPRPAVIGMDRRTIALLWLGSD
jgi:hypothetical protein